MDEESNAGMDIPPGITSLWMRNPLEEWKFRRELPAQIKGIPPRNIFPSGITISWTRNLPEELLFDRESLS
jgi:hypothetical protein